MIDASISTPPAQRQHRDLTDAFVERMEETLGNGAVALESCGAMDAAVAHTARTRVRRCRCSGNARAMSGCCSRITAATDRADGRLGDMRRSGDRLRVRVVGVGDLRYSDSVSHSRYAKRVVVDSPPRARPSAPSLRGRPEDNTFGGADSRQEREQPVRHGRA